MPGFPGGASGKEPDCQCSRLERPGFNPWVGKIPWRRALKPTPGTSHGQKSPVGYSPWGFKESDTLSTHNTHTHIHIKMPIKYTFPHLITSKNSEFISCDAAIIPL